jgi:hypothetical protein
MLESIGMMLVAAKNFVLAGLGSWTVFNLAVGLGWLAGWW